MDRREPVALASVGGKGGAGLGARVASLEVQMVAANSDISAIKSDTAEILVIVKGAKSVGGYIAKYGPKVITFGAGAFTVLGIGNAKFWAFLSHFFSG